MVGQVHQILHWNGKIWYSSKTLRILHSWLHDPTSIETCLSRIRLHLLSSPKSLLKTFSICLCNWRMTRSPTTQKSIKYLISKIPRTTVYMTTVTKPRQVLENATWRPWQWFSKISDKMVAIISCCRNRKRRECWIIFTSFKYFKFHRYPATFKLLLNKFNQQIQ